jgi:thimet oligopeptidase
MNPATLASTDSINAVLATSSPADLAEAARAAITSARADIDRVKSGTLTGLALLDAYDEAGAALSNCANLADVVAASHPDPNMREAAEGAKQELAKAGTDISLDRDVYAALSALDLDAEPGADPGAGGAGGDSPGVDAATRHYLAVTLRDFRRAGVDRDDATRARIRELQEELVGVGQAFERNIRTDTRSATMPASALAGLPADYVAAHEADADGMVTVTTDYPDLLPFLKYATDGTAREQLWRLFRQRGYPSNVDVLRRLIEGRHELATLLGYPTWAAYAAEDKMVGSVANISDFIERIAAASADRAGRDYDRLLARKRVDEPDAARVNPWDSAYLDDRIKAEQLAFDSQAMRPYFEYEAVKAGVLGLSQRLFGIEFRPRPDIPRWHDEVECYDVLDGGTLIGRFFLDMHPRADKFNHAAMFTLTAGKAGRRIPECALMCNLPRPGASPALLQHSDLTTFFHEFGHLLHFIFAGAGRWSGTSGVATEWDFVEAPSQLLEEWVRDADVLATFARHYETGEVLPAEMVARLRVADSYGKGLFVRGQMFYASLSLELYRRDPALLDPVALERAEQERLTPYAYIEDTFVHLNFGHLDGYSAIYCTYMWSLVIAKDLFTMFTRDGLLNVDTARRYRANVLAPGGNAPAAQLVADFLGRPYEFTAYQTWLDAG